METSARGKTARWLAMFRGSIVARVVVVQLLFAIAAIAIAGGVYRTQVAAHHAKIEKEIVNRATFQESRLVHEWAGSHANWLIAGAVLGFIALVVLSFAVPLRNRAKGWAPLEVAWRSIAAAVFLGGVAWTAIDVLTPFFDLNGRTEDSPTSFVVSGLVVSGLVVFAVASFLFSVFRRSASPPTEKQMPAPTRVNVGPGVFVFGFLVKFFFLGSSAVLIYFGYRFDNGIQVDPNGLLDALEDHWLATVALVLFMVSVISWWFGGLSPDFGTSFFVPKPKLTVARLKIPLRGLVVAAVVTTMFLLLSVLPDSFKILFNGNSGWLVDNIQADVAREWMWIVFIAGAAAAILGGFVVAFGHEIRWRRRGWIPILVAVFPFVALGCGAALISRWTTAQNASEWPEADRAQLSSMGPPIAAAYGTTMGPRVDRPSKLRSFDVTLRQRDGKDYELRIGVTDANLKILESIKDRHEARRAERQDARIATCRLRNLRSLIDGRLGCHGVEMKRRLRLIEDTTFVTTATDLVVGLLYPDFSLGYGEPGPEWRLVVEALLDPSRFHPGKGGSKRQLAKLAYLWGDNRAEALWSEALEEMRSPKSYDFKLTPPKCQHRPSNLVSGTVRFDSFVAKNVNVYLYRLHDDEKRGESPWDSELRSIRFPAKFDGTRFKVDGIREGEYRVAVTFEGELPEGMAASGQLGPFRIEDGYSIDLGEIRIRSRAQMLAQAR